MDFLEGFLLGPIWSDTEYETRRHTGFYWFIGWAVFFVFAYLVVKPAAAPGWLNMPRFLPVLLFMLFALLSPLASRYYYQLNILLKVCIILFQIMKFGFAFLAFFQYFLPKFTLDLSVLPQTALDYINITIAKATDFFESLGQGVGMLVGIAGGGLLIVLTFAGYLMVATLAPVLFLIVLKLIQRGIDLLARETLFKNMD